MKVLKIVFGGVSEMTQWLKAAGCFFRGPGLDSQQGHDGSQQFVIRLSGDLMSPSGLHRHQGQQDTKVAHKHTCRQNINICKNK